MVASGQHAVTVIFRLDGRWLVSQLKVFQKCEGYTLVTKVHC